MYPTNYFADASLILEQHYTNVDNSELMSAFGVFDFNVAETESNVVNFLTVSDNSNHVDYSTALFALGKTYKAEYKQIYIEAMQRCLASNSQAVYQAGIAIENLGECIFNSVSLIQDEVEMLKRAQTFLARQGS